MGTWQLHLDETGNLADPSAHAALAGVLVLEPPTRGHQQLLREQLENVWAGAPWPMHAARLNTTSIRLIHHLSGLDGGAPIVREACAPAVRAISAGRARGRPLEALDLLDAEVERLRAAPEHAPEPSRHVTRAVETWLVSEHRAAWNAIRALQVRQEADMAALLRRLSGAPHGSGMLAVLAFSRGDPEGPAGAVRYLRLFEVLAERVLHLLRERSGTPHRVLVRCARYRAVRQQTLVDAWRAAGAEPPLPGAAAIPPFILPPTRYHEPGTPPGLVLADHVANRSRAAWRGTWSDVVRHMERVGVIVERVPLGGPGVDPLPSWASDGTPREIVRDALRGEPPEPPAGVASASPWTVEQALAWARAFTAEAA